MKQSHLTASAKAVGNAIKGLVDSIQSGTLGQKELSDPLEQAQDPLNKLQNGELRNVPKEPSRRTKGR